MKRWLESLGIPKKLWLFHLVTALTSGIVAGVIMILTVWTIARGNANTDVQIKASIMADNILPSLQFRDNAVAHDILAGLGRDRDILRAKVIEANGETFAEYLPERPGLAKRLRSKDLIRASIPIMDGKDRLGTVELVRDMNSVYRETTIYTMAIGVAMLVSLLVGSLLILRLQRSITVPLANLTRLMKQVSERNDYTHRTEVTSRDELGDLGLSFNHMIEQIQQRDTALGHELSERLRAEEQLAHLAHHDPVTGLPNRHFFRKCTQDLEKLQGSTDHGMALLFIDLDNFKYVNDTFGHDCGDQLLTEVAMRLQGAVRSNDIVVRFGGDEFVVLLQNVRETALALQLAEKLREILTRPLRLNNQEFVVTCSIGVAVAPLHGRSAEELLQNADAAMYHAKSGGKDGVRLWETTMSDQSTARFSMEADLRHAIDRNELEIHYQPIVDLASQKPVGMEALLRWKHPIQGYVSPMVFIPVAEESGLILQIGEWVMMEAFRQVAAWSADFGPLSIAVNVSARQFRSPNFTARADQIARDSGLNRDQIELELTESMVMGHTAEAVRIMHELVDCGFKLSLDDFGTGYSSLSYLKRFPLNKLKIDRSFVSDLPDDAESAAIAEAIAGLAHTLGMQVVAEGIETLEQAAYLADRQCRYGQGYYFSRPLPASRFPAYLAETRARLLLESRQESSRRHT
ncbi:diguanylate cyclase (GGDEF)-like protein [Fluviicoccus keumensis]|uniref:cyclic-guanylate-specific phosphodiesterase n=1 Tax=Fluviicoccus keumensis TaxID=1435465 RepID=A0A4Q7YLC6_9GAMM|nr:EAL domain-containing protein [Fluviicoccus keumensis]RZU38130.1 diguanylate cyclase (GGDEF)-like protein [Fluviicoccus keumensis]